MGTLILSFVVLAGCVSLWLLTLFSTSLFWRAFGASWLATACLTFYTWTNPALWLVVCDVTLLLWSLSLTPLQLLLAPTDMRESHAASNILWNPENVEIPKSQIEAE